MSERSPLLSPVDGTESNRDDAIPTGHTRCQPTVSLIQGLVISTAVFVLIFILTFSTSVIFTIQSPIAADLDVTSGASWFVTAYLIGATGVTPISGKLCQIFSSRLYLLVSTVVQVVGLLVTAFAPSFAVFVAGRVISGGGAAAVTPLAYILVTELASDRRRGLLFGLINCAFTTGVAFGAAIGGALEPLLGWRAVFWLPAPICLLAGVTAFFAIPPSTTEATYRHVEPALSHKLSRVDYLGVGTLIGTVALLLYSVSSPEIQVTPIVLAILSLALFILVEAHWAAEPIVPPRVMRSRATLLTGVATIGFMSARWAVLVYTPSYALAVRSWTPAQAGLLLIPTNLGFGIGSVAVGFLHVRQSGSYYTSCLVCFGLFALEHFALSRLVTLDSPMWLFAPALFVNGFLAGAILTYNLAHLLHLTRPALHVLVIPINAMFRGFSGSLGSSLAGGLFVRSLQSSLHHGFEAGGLRGRESLIAQLLSRPILVQKLQGLEREIARQSYADSIRYVFALGSLWTCAMFVLQAGTGWTAPPPLPEDELTKGDPGAQPVSRREESLGR